MQTVFEAFHKDANAVVLDESGNHIGAELWLLSSDLRSFQGKSDMNGDGNIDLADAILEWRV